jgi:GldM C-terminal domain
MFKFSICLFLVFVFTSKLFAQSVVLSCSKMNIVYVGVDNPINIAVENILNENLIISASNGSLMRNKNDGYIFRPDTPGKICMIFIISKNKKGIIKNHGTMALRAKRIPLPILKLNNKSYGFMTKETFDSLQRFQIILENFDFNVRYVLKNYTLQALGKTINVSGDLLTKEAKQFVQQLPPCTSLLIKNIEVSLYDNKEIQYLENIEFVIK